MAKQKTNQAKPVKKAAVVNSEADPEKELLARELKSLIPKLDSEGLAFLVEQARVHLYNMQVDELNKAAAKAESTAGKPKTQAKPKSGRETYSIVGNEGGNSFYLKCPNDNIIFSGNEMLQLARIANGTGTDLEIRERLYAWLVRERRDVFAAIHIVNKSDDKLKMLAALIKKSVK